MSDDMQEQLQAYYDHASPACHNARVSDLVTIGGDCESDVHSFDVEHGPELVSRDVVLGYLGGFQPDS